MPRVLVIDDDVQTCEAVAALLAEGGHEVDLAHDGREGLRRFQNGDYQLVICDLFLPELMGYDVCERIKAAPRPVPVIMVSGLCKSLDDASELGVPLHGDVFLYKPFDIDVLQENVDALLARGDVTPSASPTPGRFEGVAPRAARKRESNWVTDLAYQIVSIFSQRRSGTLNLSRGELTLDIVFARGFPVEVVVPFRKENVGLFLVQQGRLTQSEYDRALELSIAQGKALEEALWDLGYVNADELSALTQAHMRESVVAAFGWARGELAFREGPVEGSPGFQLNPSTLVTDGVAHAFPIDELESDLEARRELMAQPGAHFDEYLTLFAPLLYRTGLHALLGSGARVGDMLERAGDDRAQVVRLIKTFELLEIITIGSDEDEEEEILPPALAPGPRPPVAAVPPGSPVGDQEREEEAAPAAPLPPRDETPPASAHEPSPAARPSDSLFADLPPVTEARELWREFLLAKDADHYQALGVPREADLHTLKLAFIRALGRLRPEPPEATMEVARLSGELIARLALAYGALADPTLRETYDMRLLPEDQDDLAPAPVAPGCRPGESAPAPALSPGEKLLAVGRAAMEGQDYDRAITSLQHALELEPDSAQVHLYLALSQYRRQPKDPETIQEAARIITRSLDLDSENDMAYYHLGQIYRDQGLTHKARLMFTRALRINPNNELARRAVEALGGVAA